MVRTMFQFALQILLFGLAAAAPSLDPDNLSSFKATLFIPYASKFASNSTPTINGMINGEKHTIPVDTGSTGLIIGAPKLKSIPKNKGTFGVEYLSSSNNLYTGRFVNINITFFGKNETKAVSQVPVLIVDKAVVCPGYNVTKGDGICPKKNPQQNDLNRILYMGVGFGRNTKGSGLPYAIPSHNPFLNIQSINGKKVSDKTYRNGYTVSTHGIDLGLTTKNTAQYNWVKLDKGITTDSRDWAQVRTSFKVNDQGPFSGAALIDTGIGQMYIQAYPKGNIPNATVADTFHKPVVKGKKITVVKKDTHLDFGFPALNDKDGVAGYDFKVGDKKFKSQPLWVQPVTIGNEPHVNTGRKFLWGFSVAFDAVSGRFGFKCLKC